MPLTLIDRQKVALSLFKTPARHILLQGGSRSGKTTLLVYVALYVALTKPNSRVLISRLHLSDIKASIIHDTLPKVAALMNPKLASYIQMALNKQDYFLPFPNGSEIWFDGLSDERRSEKVLGREYCLIVLTEITQIDYGAFEKLLTRLAQNVPNFRNRFALDCNPTSKGHWAYKLFVENIDPRDKTPKDPSRYATLVMNPHDNPHLSQDYIESLGDLSTRQQKRFLAGEWLDDVEGALWNQEDIDRNRLTRGSVQDFDRVGVGVDPAVSADPKRSSETGIIVAGVKNGKGYVLADGSGIYTPSGWAKKVIELYNYYQADIIIGESNQGGDLVVSNLIQLDRTVRVKKVHAMRGKVLRADPIVGLYERDEVKHLGMFDKLEEQMTSWVPESKDSPDRVDALVHILQELMQPRKVPKIHGLR